MAWSDYRKAYDIIPHSWTIECLEMFEIAENVNKFIIGSMQTRKVELSSSGKRLEVIQIIEEEFSRAICFVHDSINNGFEIIKPGYDLTKHLRLTIFLWTT